MVRWVKTLTAAAAVVGLGLAVRPAAADDADKSMSDDVKFIHKAASGGMHEVKLGELARERAADPEVKRFGTRMVTDHTKANKELMDVAEKMGVKVPDHMAPDEQGEFDKFQTMKGREFDRAYIKHMVEDHKKDVAEFKKVSQSAKDARLKAFATKTLPTLQEHLTMAEQIASKIK